MHAFQPVVEGQECSPSTYSFSGHLFAGAVGPIASSRGAFPDAWRGDLHSDRVSGRLEQFVHTYSSNNIYTTKKCAELLITCTCLYWPVYKAATCHMRCLKWGQLNYTGFTMCVFSLDRFRVCVYVCVCVCVYHSMHTSGSIGWHNILLHTALKLIHWGFIRKSHPPTYTQGRLQIKITELRNYSLLYCAALIHNCEFVLPISTFNT